MEREFDELDSKTYTQPAQIPAKKKWKPIVNFAEAFRSGVSSQ